ncbi:MAG: hypothetical protein SO360_01865 [Bifidobacterium tsurumiense]|uniref:hypothetical protein n=1 Tax=Bifidobacterium tsurumiense TaxID=356829 RepID=UPI002A813F28|nr:hypothetical protein [Bifidobacterium tsurumiense]MDY4677599.1 hypothetical protein [Bifidobacterium tsurumiense]
MPAAMAMADRWMRWKLIHRGDGTSKMPIDTEGNPASSTDPRTWTSLPVAEESTVGDGLGFALGDGFACIDLDHCYDSRNHLLPWAKMLLGAVEGTTWIETSPSGDGLHIWGRMNECKGIKVRGLMDVEAYSQGRFMTFTGRQWRDSPSKLADLSFLFQVIHRLA